MKKLLLFILFASSLSASGDIRIIYHLAGEPSFYIYVLTTRGAYAYTEYIKPSGAISVIELPDDVLDYDLTINSGDPFYRTWHTVGNTMGLGLNERPNRYDWQMTWDLSQTLPSSHVVRERIDWTSGIEYFMYGFGVISSLGIARLARSLLSRAGSTTIGDV